MSYYADHTKLVIVSEGATQDAVIGKCVGDVSWLRRDLREIEEAFEPRGVNAASMTGAGKFENLTVTTTHSHHGAT